MRAFFIFIVFLVFCANCVAETLNAPFDPALYEREFQIKKNYGLKIENALNNAFEENSIKITNKISVTGDFSQDGKLYNIELIDSCADNSFNNKIISIIQNLQPFGTISPEKFMPDAFIITLLPAAKYSNENYVLLFEMFKTCGLEKLYFNEVAYITKLRSKIDETWQKNNPHGNKKATLYFIIKKTGMPDNITIFNSSNDEDFDNLAVKTLKESAPLPLFPYALQTDALAYLGVFDAEKNFEIKNYLPFLNEGNKEKINKYAQNVEMICAKKWQESALFPNLDHKPRAEIIFRIKINKNGEVEEAYMVKSSGVKKMDEFAYNIVKPHTKFAPFPYAFKGKFLIMELTFKYAIFGGINYNLNRNLNKMHLHNSVPKLIFDK